jgi:hypothetical protein
LELELELKFATKNSIYSIYIYCFIYFIELSKEEHLKYTCIEYIIHNNIISI